MLRLKELLGRWWWKGGRIDFPLEEDKAEAVFAGLTPSQREAVSSPYRFSLVVAGPGSGKTLTIVRRVVYMAERGIPLSQVALITFTRKAAEEMEGRLMALLGDKGGLFVGTFHSYALFLLRTGPGEYRKVMNEEESMALWREAMKEAGVKDEGVLLEIQRAIGGKKPLTKAAAEVYERYKALKEAEGKWDFDDLILEALQNPKVGLVLRPHVLVDEYQDLNWPQLRLLKLGSNLPKASLFAVGDPRQAIYGWRGGDVEIILNFPRHFPGARVFPLSENHRSHRSIVEWANGFIAKEGTGLGTGKVLVPSQIPLVEGEGEIRVVKTPSLEEDIKQSAQLAKEWASLYGEDGVALLIRGRRAAGLDLEGLLRKELALQGIFAGQAGPIGKLPQFAYLLAMMEYLMVPPRGELEGPPPPPHPRRDKEEPVQGPKGGQVAPGDPRSRIS